jgi:hypothetical protein
LPPPAAVSPAGNGSWAGASVRVARLLGVQVIANLNGAGRRQALPKLHTGNGIFRARACYGRAASL